jgi:competence protein ComEA
VGCRWPSVDRVFDKISRQARERLAVLSDQAQPVETPELSPTQEWVDDSIPDATAPTEPWWRRGPAGRLTERWLPGVRQRRIALAVAGVVLGVAVAVAVGLAGSGPPAEPPPALPAAEPPGVVSSRAAERIVVSVVGLVAKPGLVTLPDGARVADALRVSGGPVAGADLSALNLARRLSDGEQIYVGVPAPPGVDPAGSAGSAAAPGAPAKVDLNTAALDALDTLPGVGPVTAQRILDWRTEHGRFTSVDQLREIDGIGPTRFDKLKDLVVAG